MADLTRVELYDQSNKVPANINASGALLTELDTGAELTVIMESSGGNLIYIGKAPAGSAVGSAVWQIQKLTWSGSDLTNRQFAEGNTTFDNIWTSRAGYTYS